MSERTIGVVTGSRADFGLLRPLLEEIRDDPDLGLQLFVTGMHLAPGFGDTAAEIQAAGFPDYIPVDMLLAGDTATAMTKAMGLGLIGFADALQRSRPDVLVVLGDRFEILAAVLAAAAARIPVAHISGGEVTEGALDDAFRHAITKLSHLHFAGAEPFRERLLQLGEPPDRVWNVGDPALDNVRRIRLWGKARLEKDLDLSLRRPLFLVTYHPVTVQPQASKRELTALLGALDRFPGAQVIITRPNADPQGRAFGAKLDAWVAAHADRAHMCASLGLERYLSLLKQASVVLGNSSSGLSEAPALGIPTVNIGDRQKGRLRARSVIDCRGTETAIVNALEAALEAGFMTAARRQDLPFGDGHAGERMKGILKKVDLVDVIRKPFHDQVEKGSHESR